ncbi:MULTISPECIES: hypothetical protein [Haloferax]|uniref:Uncharacterized protein n=2 Tax=Haloferax TaxID=2251 RepID=A0A6G1Z760_9EURY|nr:MULTISPECIES: hypothetical protein [Haloferax]KAB1184760.1 hypothetical protein Hfx1149_16975 [Haloferax sp. CBA1149]MRW82390.1 hypothetical protein [Haloferax marinisediminis]
MSTLVNNSLLDKVEACEEKSNNIAVAKNTEAEVESATRDIRRLNQKLETLEGTAKELAFHVAVLEKVFDDTAPAAVNRAIETAEQAADISDDVLIEHANKGSIVSLEQAVDDAESQLGTATDKTITKIDGTHRDGWKAKLSSARELNQIIGGGDNEFISFIDTMRSFLDQSIRNTQENPHSLAVRWDSLTDRWEQNTEKHGWEAFQTQHELKDKTIEELKRFTDDKPVRLSDLSMETLREVKQVPELEQALQLELRKR